MEQVQTFLQDFFKNPYVVGVIGILAIVYGSLIAPKLSPTVAAWFDNPFFKVFFIFLILAVRDIHPVIAIILTLGLIVSMQTLNRYQIFGMAYDVQAATRMPPSGQMPPPGPSEGQMPPSAGQKASDEEMAQLQAEVKEEESAVNPTSPSVMHPKNRPTWETAATTPRVEDPNDPSHPGWRTLYGPNVDVSLYDLNPPYLRKNLPNQFGPTPTGGIYPPQYEDKIQPGVIVPDHLAKRYSSAYGYPVPGEMTGGAGAEVMAYMNPEINRNMLNPMVKPKDQGLPVQYVNRNPYTHMQNTDVAAKLNPDNDAYSGAQGLMWRPGYPGNKVGAEYGTMESEL